MFVAKREILGRWVAVFEHARRDRNLKLSSLATRCVRAGEVHEFLVCATADSTSVIDHVGYLGFGEFLCAGVICIGDELWLSEQDVFGRILGFDETHMPNHQNVVVQAESITTGAGYGLVPDQMFHVRFPTFAPGNC